METLFTDTSATTCALADCDRRDSFVVARSTDGDEQRLPPLWPKLVASFPMQGGLFNLYNFTFRDRRGQVFAFRAISEFED
jgi:hypothetical protein